MDTARRAMTVGVVALLCLLPVGCTSSAERTPAPAPTVSPTPIESDQEREQRLAYEAAEHAYRTQNAEVTRLLQHGGREGLTQILLETTDGPFRKDTALYLESFRNKHEKVVGNSNIVRVRRSGFDENQLLLTICADASAARVVDRSGKITARGYAGLGEVTARRRSGHWKIWSEDLKKVSGCA